MTRLVIGWGCAGLAVGLLVYAVCTSVVNENSTGAMLATGLALALLLAAVATLRSAGRSNHDRL